MQRRCMLLCKVALGRPYVAQNAGFDPATNQGWSDADVAQALRSDGGHDSVMATPNQTPGINYDEEVVYNHTQAIPSYVVVYDLP